MFWIVIIIEIIFVITIKVCHVTNDMWFFELLTDFIYVDSLRKW